MKLISRFFVMAGALALLGLASCASNDGGKPKPYDDSISTLPQNRPEQWEGSAGFGSFMPQSY